ncbi:replication-associated protein [Spider associated circular virus 1]|uniref:Replication-associated protein n=1 Tax=Spider associated circular virus 1 TaxID=2293302 RepID=A0A346BP74_9VIRU|nr:replication-associated protein [Spider associated circular virus 1]
MPFVFQARYSLLTYAQCDALDGFRVMEHLSGLGAECIVGREVHADGGVHLHCFVDFGRKFRSRKTDIFDVDGRHPNIVGSYGTPWRGYDYAIKDGDVICGGLERPEEPRSKRVTKDWDAWTEITNARDREHFWELVHHLDPKAAACNHGQLAKYADWRFRVKPAVYESPGGVSFVGGDADGRDAWCDQSGIRSGEPLVGRCLSLVLFGNSRTGKTLWARSLGSHVYTVGMVSGSELKKASNDDVKYAIFDDIRGGIKFFPAFKEWLGAQAFVTVKELYREPALMRWGKPSIWISNDDPRNYVEQSDRTWLEENCVFIEVTEAIFRANT